MVCICACVFLDVGVGAWRLSVAVRDMSSNSPVKSQIVSRGHKGVCVEWHPDSLMTSLGGVARTRLGHRARRRAGGNIDASRRR